MADIVKGEAFLKKHYILVISIMAFCIAFGGGFIAKMSIGAKATSKTQDVLMSMMGEIIEDKIAPLNEKLERIEKSLNYKDSSEVITTALELNAYTTAAELEERMDTWDKLTFYYQKGNMEYFKRNPEAREALKNSVVYPEVYQAYLRRVMTN